MKYFIDDPNVFKRYQFFITKRTKNLRSNLNKLEQNLLKNKNFFKDLFYLYKKNENKKFQYFQFLNVITKVDFNFENENDKIIFDQTKSLYYSFVDLKDKIFFIEYEDFSDIVYRDNLYPLGLISICTVISKKNIMRQIFNFAQVSNQLLIFTFLASKTFINPEFIEKLSNNYGVIDIDDAEEFISTVENLKKKIDTYDKMFEHLGLNELIKDDVCSNFFRACILSNIQNYTRLSIPDEIFNKFNNK